MADLNTVSMTGRLTRDPEVRYTPSGTPVATLGFACTNRVKRGDEWTDEPCFINVIVFGRQAESCGEYLTKGDGLAFSGRLQWSSWEDKQGGGKRSKHEVIASQVTFLAKAGATSGGLDSGSAGGGGKGRGSGRPPRDAGEEDDDDVPFVRADDLTDSLLTGMRRHVFRP